MNKQPAVSSSFRFTLLCILVLSAVIVLLGCPKRNGSGSGGTEFIDTVPLPKNVFTLFDEAMAVRVRLQAGKVLKNVEIDITPIKDKHPDLNDVALFEYSKGKIQRKVDFRRQGDKIFADLSGGKTYLVTTTQKMGRIWDSYEVLCMLHRYKGRVPPNQIAPICTRILCAPEIFTAGELFTEFSELGKYKDLIRKEATGGQAFDDLQIGGLFPPGPGGFCELCTRVTNDPGGVPNLPIQDCALGPPCSRRGDATLAAFNFEGDTVGQPPTGLNVTANQGGAVVVNSSVLGSQALKLQRSTNIKTEVDATVANADGSPVTSGIVYIEFRAYGEIIRDGLQSIAVVAGNGSEILRLGLRPGAYQLRDRGSWVPLNGAYDPGTAHKVHITVNLNRKTYTICINGETLALNKPFLFSSAEDLQKLKFTTGAAILEAFPSESVVDDIHISK